MVMFEQIITRPLASIAMVLAVVMLSIGLYSVSPFLVTTSNSIFGAALVNPPAVWAFGAGYMLVSILTIIGVGANNLRFYRLGLMGSFVALLFISVLRVISLGVFPMLWVFSLALAAVAAVCWLHSRLADTIG
jgi:hypothetical protein